MMLVRKVVTKLIRRLGPIFVTKLMPESHRALITYIERMKRKKENKKNRQKLLALMGGSGKTEEGAMVEGDGDSSDGDSSDEDIQKYKSVEAEESSDESEAEDSDQDMTGESKPAKVRGPGMDRLEAPMDIPRVDDIPVVSRIAKQSEKDKIANMDKEEQVKYRRGKKQEAMSKVVENNDDELETHFVENPYIKLREKAKPTGGSTILNEKDLTEEAQEIYYVKESGKMVVHDLDKEQEEKQRKKKRGEESDSDDEGPKKGASSQALRKLVKNQTAGKGASALLAR
mmetsp:Transcript_24172/g.37156  ORF Transcript_24172/g.37156 Transcript_24172/m.37156 type:complete len:286 (+) Transcript_24172:3185-4042(+)